MAESNLEDVIEKKIGEVRFDTLDLSFGEIMSLYASKELRLAVDFQRFFRWSEEQQSRLIESILLGLPIPQIFAIENQDGVLELVDGLQRTSSVMHFAQPDLLDMEPLVLRGCDLVQELNGKSFQDLSRSLRLGFKRSTVRTVVIKKQSTTFLRYAMFKRLNTGGSELSDQEIRNVNMRMAGSEGGAFADFLQDCAKHPAFATCVSTLPEGEIEQRTNEEFALRFFALKNAHAQYRGNVRDWIEDFMEAVIFKKTAFVIEDQRRDFDLLFSYLSQILGEGAFVRYRDNKPTGGLAPSYFEAVSLGTWSAFDHLNQIAPEKVRAAIIAVVQSPEFRKYVGAGSNALAKFKGRIETMLTALKNLQP